MVRNPSWSVGELIITDRIRNHRRIAQPFLKMMVVVPAAIVANRYFASAAMHNGAYTVANGGLPGDGLAHNVTCLQTAVDVEDTNGILTITGKDVNGKVITEDIIPDAGVTVQGNKAFKEITSIVGSGWVQGGTGPDTIVIGFGEKVGLPELIAAAGDVLLVGFDTALVNAPTIAVSSTVDGCTVTVPTGDGTKKLRVIYQIHQFNKDR
jgi:hypothetical protein